MQLSAHERHLGPLPLWTDEELEALPLKRLAILSGVSRNTIRYRRDVLNLKIRDALRQTDHRRRGKKRTKE